MGPNPCSIMEDNAEDDFYCKGLVQEISGRTLVSGLKTIIGILWQ